MIRPATLHDLDALVALENLCFSVDRLSRRSFRHLLTKGKADTLVEEAEGAVLGYVMVLYHMGTSLARLYSIAVHPEARGRGIGQALLHAAEELALANDCVTMRLEVRSDSSDTIALYRKVGYRQFGHYDDYYEDHMGALRLEKSLAPHLVPELVPVPYYRQTLEFTCGPASLMMAMRALDPELELDRQLELRLWRESTTIFMTSGHGGTGPLGLALAAWRRGFAVELFISEEGVLFVDSVRSEEKKEVMALVQADFEEEIARRQLPIAYRPISLEELRERFDRGGIPLVLISSWRIYHEKFPHWVVVTGFDEKFIYVHDPFVDEEKGKSETDCMGMPIAQKEFMHMARYGKSGLRAALILYRRDDAAANQSEGHS